jgi:hypothetical protein
MLLKDHICGIFNLILVHVLSFATVRTVNIHIQTSFTRIHYALEINSIVNVTENKCSTIKFNSTVSQSAIIVLFFKPELIIRRFLMSKQSKDNSQVALTTLYEIHLS